MNSCTAQKPFRIHKLLHSKKTLLHDTPPSGGCPLITLIKARGMKTDPLSIFGTS